MSRKYRVLYENKYYYPTTEDEEFELFNIMSMTRSYNLYHKDDDIIIEADSEIRGNKLVVKLFRFNLKDMFYNQNFIFDSKDIFTNELFIDIVKNITYESTVASYLYSLDFYPTIVLYLLRIIKNENNELYKIIHEYFQKQNLYTSDHNKTFLLIKKLISFHNDNDKYLEVFEVDELKNFYLKNIFKDVDINYLLEIKKQFNEDSDFIKFIKEVADKNLIDIFIYFYKIKGKLDKKDLDALLFFIVNGGFNKKDNGELFYILKSIHAVVDSGYLKIKKLLEEFIVYYFIYNPEEINKTYVTSRAFKDFIEKKDL